jgi:ribosome-associated protein
MIPITPHISIREDEVKEEFIRATGPGGQNVNKVASAVQLRFNVANSTSLPADVRRRLMLQESNRINDMGILILTARRFKSQVQNRRDALERLREIITRASLEPGRRRRTRPTKASKERRLVAKKRRALTKRYRQGAREGE